MQRAADRWSVEEAIQEAKQQMGFESTRGWCSKTVNRQAPLAMVLTTLVKAWYARAALTDPTLLPTATPWHPGKTRPTFLDMLSALRRVLWHDRVASLDKRNDERAGKRKKTPATRRCGRKSTSYSPPQNT